MSWVRASHGVRGPRRAGWALREAPAAGTTRAAFRRRRPPDHSPPDASLALPAGSGNFQLPEEVQSKIDEAMKTAGVGQQQRAAPNKHTRGGGSEEDTSTATAPRLSKADIQALLPSVADEAQQRDEQQARAAGAGAASGAVGGRERVACRARRARSAGARPQGCGRLRPPVPA